MDLINLNNYAELDKILTNNQSYHNLLQTLKESQFDARDKMQTLKEAQLDAKDKMLKFKELELLCREKMLEKRQAKLDNVIDDLDEGENEKNDNEIDEWLNVKEKNKDRSKLVDEPKFDGYVFGNDSENEDEKKDEKKDDIKRKSTDKPKSQYQLFIGDELRKQRAEQPGLKNNEYMKLAARSWNKYKEEYGIVTKSSAKTDSTQENI